MRLSREDNLHRPVTAAQDAGETLNIGEEKIGALIGGEAASEADRQDVGVEEGVRLAQCVGRVTVSPELSADGVTQELSERHLLSSVGIPPGARINAAEALPEACRLWSIGVESIEVGVQELLVDDARLAPHPGRHVHPIGDPKDLVGDDR